jgi:hypothetical protein
MGSGIRYVFQNPVRHTGVERVIGERKVQTVKDLGADACIVVQNLGIDVDPSN